MNKKKSLIIAAIAAAVLVGVLLLLLFLPKGGGESGADSAATVDQVAKLETSTDKDGVHQAAVGRDSNGNIDTDSYGTLMEYVPADIEKIHIENNSGTLDVISKTEGDEATVYTIEGYEDFDLQTGTPDLIASAAASLSFTKIAAADSSREADFGLDKPRAIVTVNYSDGTKALIMVGSDAPQGAGTYVKFGSGEEIYVVDTETVSVFDYSLTDLISLTINSSADTTDDSKPKSIAIKLAEGKEKEISLVPYGGDKNSASYLMSYPIECYANEQESSLVEGGIRGLYASKVLMVNPSNSQLEKLGLLDPYAHITAVYPDTEITLICSKPDSDGNVNLMVSGGKVVYLIAAEKVPWSTTSYEKLLGEYVINPKMISLSGVNVSGNGKNYSFTLKSETSTTTDDDGEETTTTVTTVFLGDKEIQLGDFTSFYDAAGMIKLADAELEDPSGDPALTITYTYSEDGTKDTAEFYSSDSGRYIAVLNGRTAGHATKADVTRALNAAAELAG